MARNGHDWSDRFPLIAAAALRNRFTSFVVDGEAVLLGHAIMALSLMLSAWCLIQPSLSYTC